MVGAAILWVGVQLKGGIPSVYLYLADVSVLGFGCIDGWMELLWAFCRKCLSGRQFLLLPYLPNTSGDVVHPLQSTGTDA